MALTQAQWQTKITSLLPGWWFESNVIAPAVVNALAAVFAAADQDTDDQFNSTFITHSTSPALDAMGDERGIERLPGELDGPYAQRVQRITSQTNKPAIEAAVNALLIEGVCTILEAPQDAPYCSRDVYCARGNYILEYFANEFLILVPPQQHPPYSFINDGTAYASFCARKYFCGSTDISTSLYASIIATVNQMKAFGVLYGIVEEST